MSAHILHDPSVIRSDQPCAFCLKTDKSLCRLHFVTGKKRSATKLAQLDVNRSTCTLLVPFKIGNLSKSSNANPTTNHPIACPLTTQCAEVVWRYNLKQHLSSAHQLDSISLENYRELWDIGRQEKHRMKNLWDSIRLMKGRRNTVPSGLRRHGHIKISSGHSTRSAFRRVIIGRYSRKLSHCFLRSDGTEQAHDLEGFEAGDLEEEEDLLADGDDDNKEDDLEEDWEGSADRDKWNWDSELGNGADMDAEHQQMVDTTDFDGIYIYLLSMPVPLLMISLDTGLIHHPNRENSLEYQSHDSEQAPEPSSTTNVLSNEAHSTDPVVQTVTPIDDLNGM